MNNMYGRFLGSKEIMESDSENHEVVPTPPEEWNTGYAFRSFTFVNKQDCTVVINGDAEVFLEADQGFDSHIGNPTIESFVIKESGIRYQYVATY